MERTRSPPLTHVVGLFAVALLAAVLVSSPAAGQQGITSTEFFQVDFVWDDATQRDSSWGHIRVDHGAVLDEEGLERGYLNVVVDDRWVVRNVVLDQENEAPTTSTSFDLDVQPGTDVSEVLARVVVASQPATGSPPEGGEERPYPVEAIEWNYEGVEPVTGTPDPPDEDAVTYGERGDETNFAVTLNPVNVHAGDNQCYPMSIANSLAYLNETYDLGVPDPHEPGADGDETLVGQLDDYSGRTTSGPTSGSGIHATNMIPGKVDYLQDHGLDDNVSMSYQGWYGPNDPGGDWTVDGYTIEDDGGEVTHSWVCDKIRDGADLELVYSWPGGAHAVRIYGCGQVAGQPYIMILDDTQQSDWDPNNDDGLRWATWYLTDGDNDDRWNISGSNQEIQLVTAETYTGDQAASPGLGFLGIGAAVVAASLLAGARRRP